MPHNLHVDCTEDLNCSLYLKGKNKIKCSSSSSVMAVTPWVVSVSKRAYHDPQNRAKNTEKNQKKQ